MNQAFRPLTCFVALAVFASLASDAAALNRHKQSHHARKAHAAVRPSSAPSRSARADGLGDAIAVIFGAASPEQRAALQKEPALAAQAVEEIFRFASPIERMRAARRGGLTRYASVDVEVDGVTLRAGDTVMFAVQEANEDASVFPDPKRFDITRERIPHLSLSHGAHFCLGAHLARLQLQYLFISVLQRFPALRLAVPLEEIQPLREAVAGAVSELPVAW